MKRSIPIRLWPAAASLLLFGGLCAIVAYWALQLSAPAPAVAPADLRTEGRSAADPRAVAALFGVPSQASALPMSNAPSNLQVVGIAAGDARASAIIAVDGAPGRFFAVGSQVTDSIRLVEVKARSVVIERGGQRSELPAPLAPDLAILNSGVGKARQPSSAATPPFGAAAGGAAQARPGSAGSVTPPGVPTPGAGMPTVPSAGPPGGPATLRANSNIPNSQAAKPAPGGNIQPGQNPAAAGAPASTVSPASGDLPPGAKRL